MISFEQARNVSTEHRRESGSFPAGTDTDAQRRRNAAPLRRRDNIPDATAIITSASAAYKLT
jgi:hypothetical protein